jgi:hypothetical protein
MFGLGLACLLVAIVSFGSAAWLTLSNLSQVNPPQEVLQGNVW